MKRNNKHLKNDDKIRNNDIKKNKTKKYIIILIALLFVISIVALININNSKKDTLYSFESQARKYNIKKENIEDLKIAVKAMYNQYMLYEYNGEKYLVINIAKVNKNNAVCNIKIDNIALNGNTLDVIYESEIEQISVSSSSIIPKTIYGYSIVKLDNSFDNIRVLDKENSLMLREFVGGAYKNMLVTPKGEVISYNKDKIVYKVDIDKYMIPNKTQNNTLLVDNFGNELNTQNGIVADFEYIMSYGYSKYSTIYLNGKYGIIDNNFNIVLEPNYDNIKISDKGILTIEDETIDLTQDESIVKEELNKILQKNND